MLRLTVPVVTALLYASIASAQTVTVAGGKTARSNTTGHDAYRAEVNFGWKPDAWANGNWTLSINHALAAMTFRDRNNVNAISWAPNIILTRHSKTGLVPYLQLGFGVAYLSDDKFESEPKKHPMYQLQGITNMGSHWQFESSLAVGLKKNRFGVRAKIYHYSNAELAHENEGMDVAEFGLSYSF
tara:strand:- start:73550 stop:74104 length:555 start_codon:yes stop_codon:yes gene_type:complete